MPSIRFLNWQELLDIHRRVLEAHGGLDGILNIGGLKSALAMPEASFGSEYLHEDLASMAAAYLFHVSESQGFNDGNKRTGVAAALIFLKLNGMDCSLSDDALYDLTMKIAAHTTEKTDAADLIRHHLVPNTHTPDRDDNTR